MHIEVQTAAHCRGITVAGGQMQRMQLMQTMNLHQESRNDIELMQKLHLVIQYILLIHHTQVYMVPLYMFCIAIIRAEKWHLTQKLHNATMPNQKSTNKFRMPCNGDKFKLHKHISPWKSFHMIHCFLSCSQRGCVKLSCRSCWAITSLEASHWQLIPAIYVQAASSFSVTICEIVWNKIELKLCSNC